MYLYIQPNNSVHKTAEFLSNHLYSTAVTNRNTAFCGPGCLSNSTPRRHTSAVASPVLESCVLLVVLTDAATARPLYCPMSPMWSRWPLAASVL